MSLILLAVSVIFTLLVAFVGKAPVGPENSEVGFAALNAALHDQFGYNTVFYGISSVLGYLTILTALINCVSFLVNLVKKKDLRMVRADLTATLGIYILLAVLYLVFEQQADNAYRNHRYNNVEHVFRLVVHLELEQALQNPVNLAPQNDERRQYGSYMHSNGKHQILLTILHTKQGLTNSQMTATADGQILCQSLNDS